MPLILFAGKMASLVNASRQSTIQKAPDDGFASGKSAPLEMQTSQWLRQEQMGALAIYFVFQVIETRVCGYVYLCLGHEISLCN